ncbi:hypothetical protein [Cylindrospermopsis raciborskii]|nr:hypothetical protein [Cylindrospermopsis raciborskii]
MKDETQHPQPILQIIVPPYKEERSPFYRISGVITKDGKNPARR